MIDCGFKPAYVMVKRTDSAGSWRITDSQRDSTNPNTTQLWADLSNSEADDPSYALDLIDTGFQIKSNAASHNASGGSYIYMAFAEQSVPQITFSTDKASIDFDLSETATLSWDVQYANPFTVELTPGYGVVPANGSQIVSPVAPSTYTLTVTSNGQIYTEQLNINVINGGYDHAGTFTVEEKIGVGVLNPANALEVNGTIKAKEIIVSTDGWADYVFAEDYTLRPIEEVEQFIKQNRHLPGLKPGRELEVDGLSISETLKIQQQKIEELTLYVINQNKKLLILQNQNEALKKRLNLIEKQ